MFIYLETHKPLKALISFFFILMLALTLFNDFAVTSNAFAISASMGILISSMLVSTGIALSNESFTRGIASMYGAVSAGVKTFIDSASKLITAGTAASVAIPVKILSEFKKTATTTFDPGKTVVPDTSGTAGTAPEILNSPNLTNYQTSDYVGRSLSYMYDNYCKTSYNVPVFINTMSTDSPNKAIAVPILEKQILDLSSGNPHKAFNATGTNNVLRISTFSGLTFDYAAHVSGVKDNPKQCLLEVSENGKCIASKIITQDSLNWSNSDFSFVIYDATYSDGSLSCFLKGSGLFDILKFNTSCDRSCINSGICDRTTGVLPVPSISYLPDVGGICSDGVWDKAVGGILAKNPDATVDLNIPASTDALTNAKWDSVLANQAELTAALREAIAALQNPPAVPDVDIGDVGVSTITGGNNNLKKLDDFFVALKPDINTAMNGVDPSVVTIPNSIYASVLWVNQQFLKCFNSLGDFQFIVLLPMFIGILLLIIGRGSQAALSTRIRLDSGYSSKRSKLPALSIHTKQLNKGSPTALPSKSTKMLK